MLVGIGLESVRPESRRFLGKPPVRDAKVLVERIDRRLLRLSHVQGRCAALPLCQSCSKSADAPCGLQRLFNFLLPAVAVIAAMPLFGAPNPVSYNTRILDTL